MSKQCTLFRAWGGKSSTKPSSSSSSTNIGRTCVSSTSGKGEVYTFDDFDQFDEFFQDDVADELVKVCDHPNEAGPSRPPSLNASIIEDIPGFDVDAGQLWVYPTNYPVRDYQFNIVQKALFRNVLVCLPTGLGKTFIAAVVMYNFYRWYPSGKIVFLAPTKPLVTQQIEACYNVMGIPQSDAAEMTGNLPPRDRNQQWRSRRVFFLTPQVMQNDLARGACPAEDVCCVVFDEAHKALGNHAYCQVVKELSSAGSRFRVLALSATPGNDLKAVQQVVTNLQISQIELRSEDSFDIQRYVHERQVEKFVVPFQGEILEVKTAFLKVLSGVVSRLARLGLLYHSNADRISKYQILQARDQYRMNPPQGAARVHVGVIEGDFALAISLYHAYELLLQHGMRSFHQFLTQTFSAGGGQSRAKMEVMRSPEIGRIMRNLQEKLGQGSVPDSPGRRTPRRSPGGERSSGLFFYSHPKLIKLEEVVVGHFRKLCEQSTSSACTPGGSVNTRVMIFSQYRESVQEIADMLSQHAPLVRVMSFVGHSGKSSSKGLTQKEQTEVVRNFRQGGYNTLVATCVGEEGLDIGEVDLIVCFDAHKSPIRLVQRMGRTGRKRSGRIVVIVAEGKEDQIYLKSQSNKTSIHRAIRDGCKSLQFYQAALRMVPRHIHPEVHKMHMSIDAYVDPKAGKSGRAVKGRGGQSRLSFGPTKKDPKGVYLTDSELDYWSKNFALSDRDSKAIERAVDHCVSQPPSLMSIAKLNPKHGKETSPSSHNVSFGVNSSMNSSVSQSGCSLSLSRWVQWQTAPVSHKIVSDSLRSRQLTSSLEFMDLCQTSEGMGHSYELEMETFLNLEDVKTDWRGRRGSPEGVSEGQEKDDGCMRKKNKTRKRQRIFEDSSEDEDFRPSSSKRTSVSKTAVVSVDEGDSNSGKGEDRGASERDNVIMVDSEEVDGGVNEGDAVIMVGEEELPPEGNLLEVPDSPSGEDGAANLDPNDRGLLTDSQHVIPKAPSVDSLDWLDELEPSQISTPRVTPASKREGEKGGTEFCFATPKLPPSSRKTRPPSTHAPPSFIHAMPPVTHATPPVRPLPSPMPPVRPLPSPTPPVTHATPPVTPIPAVNSPLKSTESIDLFSDLSSTALFDVFSLSFQHGPNTNPPAYTQEQPNKRLSKMDFNPQLERGACKSTSPVLKNQDTAPQAAMVDNCVDLDEEMITAIAESDLEGEDEPEGCQPVTPKTETRDCHSAPSESVSTSSYLEDSFLLAHGRGHKKQRNGVEFLRSPTGASCSSVSPHSKENKTTVINLSDEASDTQIGSGMENPARRKYPAPKRGVGKVVCVDSESSDDEFQAPLLRRVRRQTVTFSAKTLNKSPGWEQKEKRGGQAISVHGFVEDEAELSSDGHCEASADEDIKEDSNCYDFEDSFINDASMLTQISPTQRPAGATRGTHPPGSMGDVYRRSLMSPDTLFAGQQRRMGNQYRMVFSQRHRLLNHYINKAGFNVSPSARKSRSKKPRLLSDSVCEVAEREGCLAETTASSCSEAEEVHLCYGEEEEELPDSQTTEDVGCRSEPSWDRVSLWKRKPGFLSESDMEGSEPQGDDPPAVCGSSAGKRMKFSRSPGSLLDHTAVNEREKGTVPQNMLADDVIISPSLLANINVHSTPSCFSLGMEEWIDSGSSSNGREEGEEGESPIQPNISHLTTDDDLGGILTQQELEENFDLRVDCFSDLDTPDEEGGGPHDCNTRGEEQVPSDPQPCERQMCQKTASCSAKAGDSNQTFKSLGIAGSVDTPPFVQPNPPSIRTTNMIAPGPSPHATCGMSGPSPYVTGGMSDPSPHATCGMSGPSPYVTGGMSGPSPHATCGMSGPSPYVTGGMSGPSPHATCGISNPSPNVAGGTSDSSPHVAGGMCGPSPYVAGGTSESSPPGTILVSSREVTYSQIASTLRYKHNLQVTLCSLSHGGYIVSNRMVVERKLHSEFVTASAGSKVLAKLSDLKGLFDRVCLIIEEDPVREGRRKTTAKPGHYLECALARLIASRVTVLFSQSQANTASLLAGLVERERRKGHGISVPGSLQEEAQHVLPMLLTMPHMSYITALNLCASFRTLHMLLQSSPEELRRRIPSLSLTRAQEICNFFGRTFNPHLVG